MWPIEARNAAIANTYFVACNNRIGRVSVSQTYIMIFIVIVHVILIALLYCKYFVYVYRKSILMSLLLLMENLVILKYLSY